MWKRYPISHHSASALRNLVNSSLLGSHQRLMVAVSYNLWSSADHRCWSVGWGAFLIKRQMSGEEMPRSGITKDGHCFRKLHLPHCPMDLMGEMWGGVKAPLNCSQWQMGLSSLYYTCAADMEVNRCLSGPGNCSIMKGIGQCLP